MKEGMVVMFFQKEMVMLFQKERNNLSLEKSISQPWTDLAMYSHNFKKQNNDDSIFITIEQLSDYRNLKPFSKEKITLDKFDTRKFKKRYKIVKIPSYEKIISEIDKLSIHNIELYIKYKTLTKQQIKTLKLLKELT